MNKWLSRILFGLFALCGMFLVSFLSYQGHWAIALGFAVFLFISLIIFAKKNAYPLRFMYPGLITFFLFLVLPIVFTVLIGFTNLGTGHLLSKGTVKDIIASETVEAQEGKAKNLAYLVIEEGSRYDIYAHDDQTNKNYKSSFTLGNKLIKLEEFSGTMPEEGMAKGKLFQKFLRILSILISSIMTTNRNKTITAPRYTRTKVIPKNSARNKSQIPAACEKARIKLSTACTGLRAVITRKAANSKITENK